MPKQFVFTAEHFILEMEEDNGSDGERNAIIAGDGIDISFTDGDDKLLEFSLPKSFKLTISGRLFDEVFKRGKFKNPLKDVKPSEEED